MSRLLRSVGACRIRTAGPVVQGDQVYAEQCWNFGGSWENAHASATPLCPAASMIFEFTTTDGGRDVCAAVRLCLVNAT